MDNSAELFQIKNDAVKVLHSICQQIWKTQKWPQEWKRSGFIPIPKKGKAKECSNYHRIAHGRLLDKSQVHTLGSWEGLKSPYHPLPSSSPLTLSLLGCLVHHWPHHQQGTFPEHLLGSVCSGHGHLAPLTGQCKQLK